jgi:hypothetical protein
MRQLAEADEEYQRRIITNGFGRELSSAWIRPPASASVATLAESWSRDGRKGGFTCWRTKAARG